MKFIKQTWGKVPKSVRKLLVFIIGWAVVITGIILLPLPGPGWAVIFLGFAILATEFTSAEKVRDFLIKVLKLVIDFFLKTWNKLVKKPKK